MPAELLFVSVPSFYASVERARHPELRTRPVIVGGNPRKRGVVQSASPDALEMGVEEGMTVLDALARCPRARTLRTDMKHYREVSGLLRAALRSESKALEPVGLDAAYLDASAPGLEGMALAEAIAARVGDELALPLRIGIAAAKFLAKIAAEQLEFSGIRVVRAGEEADFLHPLPLAVLPGVGPKTVRALEALGAARVGELPGLDPAAVEAELGNHGLRILGLASGRDPSPVRAARFPRLLSQKHTFEEAQLDRGVIAEQLHQLASGLEGGLRRQGLGARRLVLELRYADLEAVTRSKTVPQPLLGGPGILAVAEELLGRTHAGTRAIRTIGLSLSRLATGAVDDRQLELFDPS